MTHYLKTVIPVYKLPFNEPRRWYRRVSTDLEITVTYFKILYQHRLKMLTKPQQSQQDKIKSPNLPPKCTTKSYCTA